MELVFYHLHSFLSINLFRKITDDSESDTVTVLFQDFHIFKSKTGSHCTAHSGDHLVGGRVGCIYGNIAGNRLHYRQSDGIVRRNLLHSPENQRMVRDDHVSAFCHGFIHQLRSAVEADENLVHLGRRRADYQSAVVPFFLYPERRKLLKSINYILDNHIVTMIF